MIFHSVVAANVTAGNNIYLIRVIGGNIGPGPGKGLNILAGRSLILEIPSFSTTGTHITIGPTGNGVGTPIILNANGLESAFTYNLDSSVTNNNVLHYPVLTAGLPTSALSSSATPANFSATKMLPFYVDAIKYYIPANTAVW